MIDDGDDDDDEYVVMGDAQNESFPAAAGGL
jgi:hypothetical protein